MGGVKVQLVQAIAQSAGCEAPPVAILPSTSCAATKPSGPAPRRGSLTHCTGNNAQVPSRNVPYLGLGSPQALLQADSLCLQTLQRQRGGTKQSTEGKPMGYGRGAPGSPT